MAKWIDTGTFAATSAPDIRGRHAIASEVDGVRTNEQVRKAEKDAFYADDSVWDHEFCSIGDNCGSDCTYFEPDTYGYRDR